jgi:iron complex outermembrane recepter protein
MIASMMRTRSVRRAVLLSSVSLAASVLAAPAFAADEAAPATVDTVEVVATAVHVSPSAAPVNPVQPTSNIQREFIQNNIIPLASFDDIVKFSPSVADQSPNGPGLGKSETLTLRGFQDGQFNITFDGIPFGDATDLHHTSSALFIAHDIGEAQIDRGPGTASTIGNATFGGSMNFLSKAPLDERTINPYATYGSFNTYAGGLEVDSGETPVGKLFIDGQYETSDGYLTHAEEQRTNFMFKDVFQASDRVTLTLQGSANHAFEYTTQGATLANIKAFGPNFGLSDDPKTQAYYRYQPSNYFSDFVYGDIKARLTDQWTLQDTVYTDSFEHKYTESSDASDTNPKDVGVTYYSATKIGSKLSPQPAGAAADIPGKWTDAKFRAYGNILRMTGDLPFGAIKFGLWYEQNNDARWSQGTDLTQGNIPVAGKYGTPYTYDLNDGIRTLQPYVELEWKVTPDFVINPGVRYTDVERSLSALLNKIKPPAPADFHEDYTPVQPSISARYTLQPGWSVYAQAAKGFLAPPIDLLEVNGGPLSIKPEETWNYQAGSSLKHGRWVVGVDGYYIDFSNYITSVTIGGQANFRNGGGAVYSGGEVEVQYVLDHGFSLYGNASYNSAKYKGTDVWLAEVPQSTAALGVLYDDKQGPYASLIGKFIGSRYGLDVPLDGSADHANQYGLDGYWTADLAFGWRFRNPVAGLKNFSASVKVSNLFDNKTINDYAGQQSATSAAFPDGQALYWTMPGRSAFLNLSASF